MKTIQVFVDLDGVMADFDAGVVRITGKLPHEQESGNAMWNAINSAEDFFQNLPVMENAMHMWNFLLKYNPIVLTATGHKYPEDVDRQKRAWVKKHLGSDIEVITVQRSREKQQYAHERAILIDDRSKSIDPWLAAGGNGILHVNVIQTLTQFPKMMDNLK